MTLKENATMLNNNYYITTMHLTRRHELMGEQVFFNKAALGDPVLPQTPRNMEQHEECHKQSVIPEINI